MPELSIEIGQCATTIRKDVRRVQDALRELATLVDGERVEALLAAARVALMGATAECNRIDVLLAAGRTTGLVTKRPVVSEAEEKQLILASLHRIGDHTLDDEDEAQENPMAGSHRSLEVGRA